MLKLGYFSHTNFSPSETFIYDLVKALSKEKDIDITYVTGQSTPLITDFPVKSIATSYSEQSIVWAQRLYKLGQIKGENGYKWQMRFRQWMALKQLQKSKLPKFNVAFIDYATSGVLIMDYLVQRKIPFIVHVHGYDITTCLNDKAYRDQLQKLFRTAKGFIAASAYMKRRLILQGCDESKISIARIGIDSANIKPLAWNKRRSSHPSIIFLGRLTEKKNPIALLYAFRLVKRTIPNATLSIIGDGPLLKEVKNNIDTLGLNNSVKLYGSLNREVSFPILNNHWIYVQHSVTSTTGDTEGFAISLAEAALHELPVVSTIHNGITENVINGITGYLVPEYDYETMAEKIIFLIQNPDNAESMGKEGRKHIIKLCEPRKRVSQIKELLLKTAYSTAR